jgi:hypothetical protein
MLCMICKNKSNWSEYTVCNTINVCHECKNRFVDEILLCCNICDSMCFIPKTFKNVERLKFFITTGYVDFMLGEVIVPMHGCPHCVSYKHNPLGEVKDEYKDRVKEEWR